MVASLLTQEAFLMPRSVLSIDWDYFTGDTAVHPGCRGCSWPCDFSWWSNISLAFQGNPSLPRTPHNNSFGARESSSLEDIFSDPIFSNFQLQHWSGSRVVAADCHASLYRLLKMGDVVDHVDWHRDDQTDGPSQLWCGNWVDWAIRKKGVVVQRRGVHSAGEDDPTMVCTELSPASSYSLIFVCLSRAYTPPKLDKYFYRFLLGLSRISGNPIEFIGGAQRDLRVEYKDTVKKLS